MNRKTIFSGLTLYISMEAIAYVQTHSFKLPTGLIIRNFHTFHIQIVKDLARLYGYVQACLSLCCSLLPYISKSHEMVHIW